MNNYQPQTSPSRHKGRKIALVAPFEENHHYSHLIKRAMERIGVEVVPVDYRRDRNRLGAILSSLDVDAVIVNRGEWINPDLIRSLKVPTMLWYGEYIWGDDADAEARRGEVIYNGAVFDYVIWEGHNEPKAIQLLKNLNCSNVSYVYPVRIASDIYRKIDEGKIYDISFIGSKSPRREKFLNYISENSKYEVRHFVCYNLEEQVKIINRSKICLHINFANFTTHSQVNLRVMDVLGCGGFMLSEGVEYEEMFIGGEHLAYFKPNDPDDLLHKINYYLENEKEREKIAERGRKYLFENYSIEKTVTSLLDIIDFDSANKEIKASDYGYALDKFGTPTKNKLHIENSCRMMIDPSYPQHHHMTAYKLFELGDYDGAYKSCQRALELCPDQPITLDLMTRVSIKLGNIIGAEKQFRKLKEIEPSYAGRRELEKLISIEKIRNSVSRSHKKMEVGSD